MGKTAMSFMRIRFVVHVRRFGNVKITVKFLSEYVEGLCRCRLYE